MIVLMELTRKIVRVHQLNINVMVMVDALKTDGDVMAGMIARILHHRMNQLSYARILHAVHMLSAAIISDAYENRSSVMVQMTVVTILMSYRVINNVCHRSFDAKVISFVYRKSSGELN